ncbi:MAG: helix-hairpin-helix domain-containing protein, partial [Chthoniobacterales bacterium]
LLSNEINNTDKISVFVGECKRMGIPILPPDVNHSALKFTPENSNSIRYGLAAIKNVGESAMEAAIRERERGGEFASLEDFCRRLDSRVANRKMLESLVKAGAFDFVGRTRAELFACIDESLAAASASHRDRASGQVSLFDDLPPPSSKSATRAVIPWSQHETMSYEKELLGFYVTGHPLDAYAKTIAEGNYQTINSLGELQDRSQFRIAGAIAQVDRKFTKKEGKPFAVVWVEDLTGTLEVVLWNEVFVKVSDFLAPGRVIAIQGKLDNRDDAMRATADKARLLKADAANGTNGNGDATITLRFSPSANSSDLQQVKQLLATSPGLRPVQLLFERADGGVLRLDAGADLRVEMTPELQQRLARWL